MPGPLSLVDEQKILDWIYGELERETGRGKLMKPATVARKLKSLCGLFTLAVDCELIERNPVSSVQKKHKALLDEGEPRDRWLSYDEEKRLRDALDRREARIREQYGSIQANQNYDSLYRLDDPFIDYVKPAVNFACRTGLRRGEQMQLTWPDIDFERERIRVRGETSKGSKTHYVPMCQEVVDILTAWKPQTCRDGVQPILVFGNAAGELRREVHAYEGVLADAKIEDFTWHDMRHTFATHLGESRRADRAHQQVAWTHEHPADDALRAPLPRSAARAYPHTRPAQRGERGARRGLSK
jgi:integrase